MQRVKLMFFSDPRHGPRASTKGLLDGHSIA